MAMTASKSAWNLQVSLVDGANAATNMALTGIHTDDTILWCGELTVKGTIETLLDITSTMSIPSDGQIQASGATNNDQLWVWWVNNSL